MRQITLVVAGPTIVTADAAVCEEIGNAEERTRRSMVPCAAAEASKSHAGDPFKLVVVTVYGVAAAVRSAAANRVTDILSIKMR